MAWKPGRWLPKGQPADVSLLIAPFPGAMASGTIIPGSATLVTSILTGLAVPKGRPKPDISTPAAVKKALLSAKTIGYEDPDFTVAGQGAWEALTKLGVTDQVATKSQVELGPASRGISPDATNNVTKTSKRLEDGDIDIGLLMLSDMVPEKDKYDIVGALAAKNLHADCGGGVHLQARQRSRGGQGAPAVPGIARGGSDLEGCGVRAA